MKLRESENGHCILHPAEPLNPHPLWPLAAVSSNKPSLTKLVRIQVTIQVAQSNFKMFSLGFFAGRVGGTEWEMGCGVMLAGFLQILSPRWSLLNPAVRSALALRKHLTMWTKRGPVPFGLSGITSDVALHLYG